MYPSSFLEMPKVGNNDVQAWVLAIWTEPEGPSHLDWAGGS